MYIIASNQLVEIDSADFENVSGFSWRIGNRGYVVRTAGRGKIEFMHRVLTRAPADKVVDHIDGNKLANSQRNLRLCTNTENIRNRKLAKSNKSGFKGVYADGKGVWRAEIKVDGRKITLGSHPSPELAHAAYCDAARLYHGEFARFA